jgi:hypothetical protein
VSFFVEELVGNKDAVSRSDLDVLEKEIQNAIHAKAEQAANSKISRSEQNAQAPAADSHINATTNADGSVRPPTGKEWQLIQVYQAIQDDEQDAQKREKQRRDKEVFRHALDSQISHSKHSRNLDGDDERRYVQHVHEDIASFHEEQQRKKEAMRRRYDEELRIRQAQIADQQRRLAEEKEKVRRMDERYLQLATEKAELEARNAKEAKQREYERQLIITRENAENKRARELEKLVEAEMDQRLMREYAEKLDRESSTREKAFSRRMKEMEAHAMKFETEGPGKARREEQLRFEQMLIKEQTRKEEDDRKKDQHKIEERQRKMREALQENQRQLAKKQVTAEGDKLTDAQIKIRFKEEMEAYRRQLEDQKCQTREHQEHYRQELDKQVEEARRSDIGMDGMGQAEKKINMSTLRELEDPQVLGKVLHRLSLSKSRGGK